jgi:acyl-coenzyme A synthetase/AMP-(fatty) acid ligase
MNIVEPIARRALAQPDAPALIAGNRVVTYARLMQDVATVAVRLREEGLKEQEVVAMASDDLLSHVLLTLAIARAGAVSVPFWNMPAERANSLAESCGVAVLVHNQPGGFPTRLASVRKQLSLHELAAARPTTPLPAMAGEPEHMFRIAFSSGTTGRPKAIRFSHGGMIVRTGLIRSVFPMQPSDRTMIALGPALHFSVGYWLCTLMSGGAVVSAEGDPADTMQALRTHGVTFLLTSPGNAVELVKIAQTRPEYAERPVHLRTFCMGGARVAPALQEAIRKHLCPALYINYGITEAGGLVAQADPALLQSHPAAAGRLLPWVEIEAVDDSGNPLPAGTEGLLRVRSPHLADGYVAADFRTSDAFRNGWFYSGDVGVVTADGLLYVGGRSDVLNVGGVKMSAERIEEVIAEDPAILECVAVTVPGPSGNAVLLPVVVAPQGFDAAALRERCVRALGVSFMPAAVLQVDRLPHNAGGKIAREEVPALVKRHFAEQNASQQQRSGTPPNPS